jgi:VWFA-related protein
VVPDGRAIAVNKRHALLLISAGLAFGVFFSQSARLVGSPRTQETDPKIKVETQVVLVDVVVTNTKTKAVLGLTKDDFHVAEDGAPQTISSFEEHKLDDAIPVVLPPMPPNVYTNFPTVKPADSVNVLLLDMLNTQPSDQSVVREQAVKYLASAPPGTSVAIFALHKNLRLVRGFTTDFSGIAAALDDKTIGARPEVSSLLPTFSKQASENEILRSMVRNMSSPVKIDSVRDYEASRAAEMNAARSEITLEALQALARFLSPIPLRKNVIWFADSFPVSFLPDAKARPVKSQELVQQTSDLLTAGQISIYPVSASGVVGDARFESTDVRSRADRQPVELETAQIAMEAIAQDTGGRAFYGRNGLSEAFATAVNEGAQYYTLAYSPTDARNDGRYRRIEVAVPHSDYKLAYRRGYFADKPITRKKDQANPEDPLIPLLAFGLPDSDKIICKVEVSPTSPQPSRGAPRAGANTELKEPLKRYRVNFAVVVDDLGLATADDGLRHGHLEEMVVAYDKDGRILNLAKQESNLTIGPEDYLKLRTIGVQLHQDIDVPLEDVILRTGIYDFNSGKSGTLGLRLANSGARPKANK